MENGGKRICIIKMFSKKYLLASNPGSHQLFLRLKIKNEEMNSSCSCSPHLEHLRLSGVGHQPLQVGGEEGSIGLTPDKQVSPYFAHEVDILQLLASLLSQSLEKRVVGQQLRPGAVFFFHF